MRPLIGVVMLLCAARAVAWDADGSDVDARIHELDAAWKGKTSAQVIADKLQRAKQPKPPDWIAKAGWGDPAKKYDPDNVIRHRDVAGWTVEVGGSVAAFTVGFAPELKKQSLALKTAEDRAKSTIVALTVPARAKGVLPFTVESHPLDWYVDERGEVFALSFGTTEPERK